MKAKSPKKRTQVKDLPEKEKELTKEEQKKVKGGVVDRERPAAQSNVLNEIHTL
jgi:hypothetical protein